MLAKTQKLEGVTSRTFNDDDGEPDEFHLPMWDLDNCTLKEAKQSLNYVQKKYRLSNIYITSDREGSYRAWCYTKVDLSTFLHILLDTKNLDYSFLYYTVKRKRATLRSNTKKGREPQKLVAVLETHFEPFPKLRERVVYDTGVDKKGYSVLLGEKIRGVD